MLSSAAEKPNAAVTARCSKYLPRERNILYIRDDVGSYITVHVGYLFPLNCLAEFQIRGWRGEGELMFHGSAVQIASRNTKTRSLLVSL